MPKAEGRENRDSKRDPPPLALPVPFEEAVADLLKVKKPDSKKPKKKAQSRERKKRNV